MVPGKTEVALMQVRQGEKVDLRQLEEGQLGYAIDTGEIFIGAPNEQRLSGRTFRNLKLLTELNGVSSSVISLLDVMVGTGTAKGTIKLTRTFSDESVQVTDNIAVRDVLTTDDAARFVGIEAIYNLAIAADDVTADKIPSLNSVNLTLNNRLQYYIRNDKKTNDLIPVGSTDGEKVTTPIAVDRTITDRLQGYISVLDIPQVMVNVSELTITSENISTIYTLYSTATRLASTKQLTMPSASATNAGLLTAADYITIQSFDARISRLEASGVWRGSFQQMDELPTSRTSPTLAGGYADINDFVTVTNGMDPHCETGQAVFRLRALNESTGEIPVERFTISQTVGSSLSDITVDKTIYKSRTGIDFDTSIIYTYSPEYNYSYDGISDGHAGEDYVVGDLVGYEDIVFRVSSVNADGGITGLTLETPTGYVEINEDNAVLSDINTPGRRHSYPADPSGERPTSEAAIIKISSTANGNATWIDNEGRLVDFAVYGISYTGTPVIGDEITLVYQASGWGFDYWISMNIAIATEHKTGVVLSSTDINKVSVGLDGTMTVNCYSSHEQRINDNANGLTRKVSINQGAANYGKTLVVDSSGNLVLGNKRLDDGIWDYTRGEFISYAEDPLEDWNLLPSGIFNLTTTGSTLHSVPGDVGSEYHVTVTSYKGKTLQMAVDMSNPLKQFSRVYDGTSWSTWNYSYASWVPGNN